MSVLISILFAIEFLLILHFFIHTLFKKGFTFKLGLSFAVLYFIFIPVWILILTGKVDLVKIDFGWTSLTDVYLNKDIKASLLLIVYLFALIIYLYFFNFYKSTEDSSKKEYKPNLKLYFIIYIVSFLIILIGSGLLEGGNWYSSRHSFLIKYGIFAVLTSFMMNSAKILIIASLVYLWTNDKLKFRSFIFYILAFTVFDMIFTGNRIYIFSTFAIIGLLLFKKYPQRVLIGLPILVPVLFYVGYFAAIFRHIRGPLFKEGIPTFTVFKNTLERAIHLDPPNLTTFFLNISESVNFNVIYNIFNRYDEYLYGATYFKPFVYFIPRSVWAEKPESITKIAANYFGSSSLVTTVIGEMHMNFAYWGILLLPFVLFFIEYFFSKFKMNSPIFNYILFIMGILILRMPFSDDILMYIFMTLIFYFSNLKPVIKNE